MEKIKKSSWRPLHNILKLDYVDDAKNKDDRYVIWNRRAGSIIVNPSVLDKHDPPAPHYLKIRWIPLIRGLIAMPDP